jgi:hypothetical protein
MQGGIRRSKSVYSQRNLGTIRQRKTLKRKAGGRNPADLTEASPEMMMRILRMRSVPPPRHCYADLWPRPNTQDFLTQQLETLHKIQQQDASKAQPELAAKPTAISRRSVVSKRFSQRKLPPIPA